MISKDDTDLLHSCNYPSPIENRTTKFYFACHDATGKMYTDSTVWFLVPSTKGNEYILCRHDYDSNYVIAEPTKNRKKDSQIKAITTITKKLKATVLRPTFYIIDNKVSTYLIAFLKSDENITVQLAPAGWYLRNAAKRAIRTFKNHLIAGLCTAHKHFPLNKWDSLLPQAVISLNILRTSCLNPKLSAHDILNRLYDFNATLMAPPGSMIMVHEKPALRGTWAAHAVNAWYLGPASHRYWCYHV